MARADYYLVKRRDRLTNGKPTYYCRFRGVDGSLLAWQSTAETSVTAARNWANSRLRDGTVASRTDLTLNTFARGWWEEGHSYIKARRARGRRISPVYVQAMRGYTTRHVLPELGTLRLTDLSEARIERWLLKLADKGLSPTTCNHVLKALRIMLAEAVRERLLPFNPVDRVRELAEHPATRGTLSLDEVRRLFAEKSIMRVWRDPKLYTAHLFMAATGARMGEAMALSIGNVHSDYVLLAQSWDRKSGLKEGTKAGGPRPVPIPSKVSKHLSALIATLPWTEPDDLVFVQSDHRGRPVGHAEIARALYYAMDKIGIAEEERRERRITTHSWRWFVNTALRAQKVSDALTRQVVGHAAGSSMTERYSTFRIEDYAPVLKVQERIIG